MRLAWGAVLVASAALAIDVDVAEGAAVTTPSAPTVARLAFVRGGTTLTPEVCLAGADGRHEQRLGPGSQPLLSPDGAIVAASIKGPRGPALILYSTLGGRPHRFFNLARATAVASAWSPDARYLAVVLASTNPISAKPSGLAVIDVQSLTYRIIAHGVVYGVSFDPDGTDRVVYAVAGSVALAAGVDLHVASASGGSRRTLTHDGRSLNPVWGLRGIAYDHERLRALGEPAFQVWLMRADGRRIALTHRAVPVLLNGLVPLAFSGGGKRLLAEYEGQDTSEAWTISLPNRQVREIRIRRDSVTGSAISRDGNNVLVDRGGFLSPPDSGTVEAVPFSGGHARVLVRHAAEPSWNL